jgi:hypothetical protein
MEKERGIKITNIDKQRQCTINVVSKSFSCANEKMMEKQCEKQCMACTVEDIRKIVQ